MRFPDELPLDDVQGPEFSVRIMRVCAAHNVKTIGELRAALPRIHAWKGLGSKSINEIRDFYKRLDIDRGLFSAEEYRHYKLEDNVSSAEALIHDVLRALTRAAIKRAVSEDTRKHMALKLHDAAKRIEQLPLFGE